MYLGTLPRPRSCFQCSGSAPARARLFACAGKPAPSGSGSVPWKGSSEGPELQSRQARSQCSAWAGGPAPWWLHPFLGFWGSDCSRQGWHKLSRAPKGWSLCPLARGQGSPRQENGKEQCDTLDGMGCLATFDRASPWLSLAHPQCTLRGQKCSVPPKRKLRHGAKITRYRVNESDSWDHLGAQEFPAPRPVLRPLPSLVFGACCMSLAGYCHSQGGHIRALVCEELQVGEP